MQEFLLFSDGSVDNESKIGFGAYLFISKTNHPVDDLKTQVITKMFENTSSTNLELRTLIWALKEIPDTMKKLTVYTDSQNITGLLKRREHFEKNNFLTKRNKVINNAELYKEFYQITDRFNCEFIKVIGHKKSVEKDEIDKIFTLVDRASRNALRKFGF